MPFVDFLDSDWRYGEDELESVDMEYGLAGCERQRWRPGGARWRALGLERHGSVPCGVGCPGGRSAGVLHEASVFGSDGGHTFNLRWRIYGWIERISKGSAETAGLEENGRRTPRRNGRMQRRDVEVMKDSESR